MNWFERYGVVGFYFVLLMSIFFYMTFKNYHLLNYKEIIIALITLATLPSGYIISIISQLYFYKLLLFTWDRKNIHMSSFEEIGKNNICYVNILKNLGYLGKVENEWQSEVASNIIGLINLDENEVDKGEWLSRVINKRMDVIAINGSIICATIIAWLLFVIMQLCIKYFGYLVDITLIKDTTITIISGVLGITSLLLVILLWFSKKLLSMQLKELITYSFTNLLLSTRSEDKSFIKTSYKYSNVNYPAAICKEY